MWNNQSLKVCREELRHFYPTGRDGVISDFLANSHPLCLNAVHFLELPPTGTSAEIVYRRHLWPDRLNRCSNRILSSADIDITLDSTLSVVDGFSGSFVISSWVFEVVSLKTLSSSSSDMDVASSLSLCSRGLISGDCEGSSIDSLVTHSEIRFSDFRMWCLILSS